MATTELPLLPSVPHQRFQVELDGRTYGFDVQWNHRVLWWVMNLYDADWNFLRAGVRICKSARLQRPSRPATHAPGEFLVQCLEGKAEPGFADLGARVVVTYTDAADMEAVRAGLAA
ncbi:hypothetical protein D7Y27_22465 [Corallococcus sp. AB004]|nr:hypothetical protein D7Y27_22465 [Corallococcus sp. AB004]